MKRLAAIVVVFMLGILPAAAESASTEPVRGAELDTMVREVLEWIIGNTEEYLPSGAPKIVFVDNFDAAIAEYEIKRGRFVDVDYEFNGSYDPSTKTVYLRDDWGGHTLRDRANLVHELVHYAQYEAGKEFECREDQELEANVLSVDFMNDRFKNQWPSAVSDLRAMRKEKGSCTPPRISPVDD